MMKMNHKLSAIALAVNLVHSPAFSADTILVSGKSGSSILGSSYQPALNGAGDIIAFVSTAGSLVGDNNSLQHVYVKNLPDGTVKRVSVSSSGSNANSISFNPSLSSDGRFVVFYSIATNLVPNDNKMVSDVFIHDMQNKSTEIVSTNSNGIQGNAESTDASISKDGKFVVFSSLADNLVNQDTFGKRQIYVKDIETGNTEIVSVNDQGISGDQDSFSPAISGNGRYIVFSSLANNLDNLAANNLYDIFLHDRETATTQRISLSHQNGSSNGHSDQAHISSDGSIIAYVSLAENIVAEDSNQQIDVFVFDRSTGKTVRISNGSLQPNGASFSPKISGNARFVSFYSSASNLVNNDNNNRDDMFVYDRLLQQITLVSIDNAGSQLDRNIDRVISINQDGSKAAFATSSALDSQDKNNQLDVYLRELDPPANIKPVARATPVADTSCSNGGAYITLDASESYDPDQEILSFNWSGVFGNINTITTTVFLEPGTHEILLTVKDGSGESSSDTLYVTIYDNQAPLIIADTAITLEAESVDGTKHEVGYQASDNCMLGGITINPSPPGVFPLGATRVRITAGDVSGNSAFDETIVTVVDTTKPVITAPDNIVSEATSIRSRVDIGEASVSDIFPVTITHNAPADFPLGKTVVTWTAIDSNNNTQKADQSITIVDTTAPQLNVPSNLQLEANAIVSTANPGTATATDIFPVTITSNAPDGFPLGDTVIQWTATDINGNKTTQSQTVTVVDTTAPVLTIPSDMSVESNAILSTIDIGQAKATDIFPLTITNNAPDVFPLGKTLVTWIAVDSSGNQNSKIQTITVIDTIAPEIIAPADILVEATARETKINLGTASAKDIFETSISNNAPDAFSLGETLVTWTATDKNGNQNSAVQKVTVIDTTAPIINAGSNITLEATHVDGVVFTPDYQVSDICACGDLKISVSPQQSFYGIGEHKITVTATDQSGNAASDSMILTVVDTTKPVLQAPADIQVEAKALYTEVAIGQATATDIFTVKIDNDAPPVFPLGTTTVTWKATDANGNMTTDKQNITVVDSTAPIFQLNILRDSLWPANHRLLHALNVENIFDAVDHNPAVDIQISSNSDHQWHNTKPDWEIRQVENQWQIFFRAEKSSPAREDRIYSVKVTVTDFSGNTSQQTAEIVVPKRQKHERNHHSHTSKQENTASEHSEVRQNKYSKERNQNHRDND